MSVRSRLAKWLLRSAGAGWFFDWATGGKGASGVVVNPTTAESNSAVHGCVTVRSEDIAKLPLILYRRRKDGGRERITDHVAYKLVRRPRPHLSGYTWREMMQARLDLRGSSYSRIYRDARMNPVELVPLHNDWVREVFSADGTPFYEVRMYGGGKTERLTSDDMLHLRTRDGKSVIQRARDVIGTDLAAANHAAKLYANGARPGGLLVPKGAPIGKDGRDLLKKEFTDEFGGDGLYSVGVVGQEMEYKAVGMSNLDMDFINGRKLSRSEIATLFRVPPHKIGIMDNATFSNIEHQSLEYVTDTLLPIAKRWEEELNAQLLRETEKDEYYFEFLFDGLLRGDFLSRMQGYQIQRGFGRSYNEIARNENWEPVPAAQGGDERLVPLNMWPMGQPRPEKTAAPAPDPAPSAKAAEPTNVVRLAVQDRPEVKNVRILEITDVTKHDSKGRILQTVKSVYEQPIQAVREIANG